MTDESSMSDHETPWKFLGVSTSNIYMICIDDPAKPGKSIMKKFSENPNVGQIEFTHDRKGVYTAGLEHGLVKYDLETYEKHNLTKHLNVTPHHFAITPDQKFIFLVWCGRYPNCRIIKMSLKDQLFLNEINLEGGDTETRDPDIYDDDYNEGDKIITHMQVTPNGKYLVAQNGYAAKYPTTVSIISIRNFKLIKQFTYPDPGTCQWEFLLSSDSRFLYNSYGKTTKIFKFDLVSHTAVSPEEHINYTVDALTPDPNVILVTDIDKVHELTRIKL